jgi:hypothetical protein
MRHLNTKAVLALAAVLGLAAGAGATEIVIGKIEKIEIKGDLRLRQENFHNRSGANPNAGGIDRSRQRFRLRLGTELPFSPKVKAKIRFASGTGEQTSTNQSFDNLSGQKQFWIDLAQLEVSPVESIKLSAGRMSNPLWMVYSSDIVWDGDYNPEGFGESFKFSLFGHGRFFLNAMQAVADEDSGTNTDQWIISQQLGVTMPLFSASRFTLAGALHEWVHESSNTTRAQTFAGNATFGQNVSQFGNRRMNGATAGNAAVSLANEFRVLEITAEYVTGLFDLPVSLQGTYIQNTAHLPTGQGRLFVADNVEADKGSQWGLIVGKAGAKGQWEAAYFHKQVAADATVSEVVDSDFGEGGTNRKGHIAWVGYGVTDYSVLQLKMFQTKVNDLALAGRSDINRFQFDYSVKF